MQEATHPPLIDAIGTIASDRRHRFWRTALSGLTPRLIAVVAVLLFFRMLVSNGDQLPAAIDQHELGGWFREFAQAYVELLIMAVPMIVLVIATSNLGPQSGGRRVAALAAAAILSAGFGVLLRVVYSNWLLNGTWKGHVTMMIYTWPRYALLGGMATLIGELVRREAASLKAMQQAEIGRAAFEREMAEARLQVLQAQIEPHFLFNTLANVRRLYDTERAAGARMLGNLIRYLEGALPRMRDSESTLGRDAELVEAFLRIQQIRMGRRLAFGIDIPVRLRTHPVPAMMLLTLAENAIKHGLARSPDGGLIRVSAHEVGDRLLLSVADTGIGFVAGSGAGTGLSNIRSRLSAQFGGRASLALENNELGGATATIALPLATTVSAQ